MGGSKKEQKEDIRVIYQVIMLSKEILNTPSSLSSGQ